VTLRRIFVGPAGIRAGWGVAIFIAIAAVEGGILFLIGRAFHLGSLRTVREIAPLQLLVQEIVLVVMAAIPTFVMSRIENRPFLSYGFLGPRRFTRFLWGALSGFVALTALVGMLALAHSIVFEKTVLSGGAALAYGAVWFLVFFLVGIAEEAFTRGYLLFTLARGLNFFWAAILVSALFGVMHSGNLGESPTGLIGAAIIGLVFCFSVWLTGSLWWAVGIHAAWDWSQSYLFGVADSGLRIKGHLLETQSAGAPWLSGGATGPEGSVFVLLVMALLALVLYLVWGRRAAFRDKRSLFAQSSS